MKLLLGLAPLLLTVVILNIAGQKSGPSRQLATEEGLFSTNDDGWQQAHVSYNVAETAEEDNEHKSANAEAGARRRLAAAADLHSRTSSKDDEDDNDNEDGGDDAEMKGRPPSLGHARQLQEQEIAAVLHALDNMDGQDPKSASMMVVTAGQMEGDDECKSSLGGHVLTKAYKNKVDYCNLQGCTVRYLLERWPAPTNDNVASSCPAHLLLPLMHSHPSVQWFLWMPSLSMFTNLSSSFPLHTYLALNKHFILLPTSSSSPLPVSLEAAMDKGNSQDPLIFLMQNSQWSRDVLAKWIAMMSTMKAPTRSTDKIHRKKSISNNSKVEDHMQNNEEMTYHRTLRYRITSSLLDVLKASNSGLNLDEMQGKVYLESGLYLHGHQEFLVKSYNNVDASINERNVDGNEGYTNKKHLLTKSIQKRATLSSKVSYVWPFMIHFEGCNLCIAPSQQEIHELCLSTFQRAFHYADNQLLALAGMKHHHLYSTLA